MTDEQKSALTTWLQTVVALAALFIPGLSDVMQIAILAVGASTLTVLTVFLPKEDPMAAFERARLRLENERGIRMETVDAAIQKGHVDQVPVDQSRRSTAARSALPRRRGTPPR